MASVPLETSHAKIVAALLGAKSGSLRIWGNWFGRPHDNNHQMVGASIDGKCLIIAFNEGETLTLESPTGIDIGPDIFRVASASRVRWEWHYYGRPKIDQNRYFEEFVRRDSRIEATTNVDWYTPSFSLSLASPAVELL